MLIGFWKYFLQPPWAQRIATAFPPDPAPLYLVLPGVKIDEYISLNTRARRAGLRTRTYDPTENLRLGATEAVRHVASSHGIVIPILPPEMTEASHHNIRAAFVAGIAHALSKPTLMIKKGNWASPLDVCEQVTAFATDAHLNEEFGQFAARVHDAIFAAEPPKVSAKNSLAKLNLGDPAAENEEKGLAFYFLERDEFRQVVDGRANIVVGRKGSGKTAVYIRCRDQLGSDKSRIVLSLSPEAYQLKKLKDIVLHALTAGSKEFLLSAFWEYVLMIEICGAIIVKDHDLHKRDHNLFEAYLRLLTFYRSDTSTAGLDFSDRLSRLIDRVGETYRMQFGNKKEVKLSQNELANILYQTAISEMRGELEKYLAKKSGIQILFDNIDKGWNASGLQNADVMMIRSLIDAAKKLKNDMGRKNIKLNSAVFLRNDIFDILLSATPDRGKDTKVLIDWTDRDLLKQIVRRRIIANDGYGASSVDSLWHQICVPIIKGRNSFDYLIDHSLMRPRYLLRLIANCLGNAINFGRNRIDELDIEKGISQYSSEVLTEIDLEINDVISFSSDTLYVFLGEKKLMRKSCVMALLRDHFKEKDLDDAVFSLFLWHGVLGFYRKIGDVTYIFDVNYDLRRLTGLLEKSQNGDPWVQVNPAFWSGLDMVD